MKKYEVLENLVKLNTIKNKENAQVISFVKDFLEKKKVKILLRLLI